MSRRVRPGCRSATDTAAAVRSLMAMWPILRSWPCAQFAGEERRLLGIAARVPAPVGSDAVRVAVDGVDGSDNSVFAGVPSAALGPKSSTGLAGTAS